MGVIPEPLAAFLEAGNSLLVAARDRGLVPACARAVGLAVHPDRGGVTVYLAEVTAQAVLAALAEVPRIAITCSEMETHRTVQLKGAVTAVRAAGDDDRRRVEAYKDLFIVHLDVVGLPPAITRRLTVWPARAVDVAVEALFEQTPGPGAGTPLGAGARP